ncbi:MAG: CrcB family protein, partial [Acidimicrobiales bacterium]
LTANIGAAFLLGLLHDTGGDALILIGAGALGSYSTFSTIVREVTETTEIGQRGPALRYLATTLVLGIGAAWLGIQLG